MERKEEYILKLKSELADVGIEIEKLIARSDKVTVEIKQAYDGLETALQTKQLSTKATVIESMSVDEVWDLVWSNVWNAVEEFDGKTPTEVKQHYKEVEPALKLKQLELQVELHESVLSVDEVLIEIWNEVWEAFWGVVEEVDSEAAIKIKQIGVELEALELKQSALQAKLHEVLMMGDEVWNVSKEITKAIVE
ncbi:MAG TPA: hypothetical protein VN441_04570 [Syntrophomonas sp.]|jgi:hypothetical protein|nr:hypothetical protein [Syntrophomonas sp.]